MPHSAPPAPRSGLPYHVGNVIPEESSLLVATVAKFNNWFGIDVKLNTEVGAWRAGKGRRWQGCRME